MPEHIPNMIAAYSDVPNTLGERIGKAWRDQMVQVTSAQIHENMKAIEDAVNADANLRSAEHERTTAAKIISVNPIKVFSVNPQMDLAFDAATARREEEMATHKTDMIKKQGDLLEQVEEAKVGDDRGACSWGWRGTRED